MKKFLTLSLTFIICIFSLTACTTREEAYQLPTETVVPEEQIKVACTALTKSRIYLELENNSDIEWTYGENRGFLIRQKGDGWAYLIPAPDIVYNDVAYVLAPTAVNTILPLTCLCSTAASQTDATVQA